MKKTLLFIAVCVFTLSGLNAQNYTFKDDFESYEEGFNLGESTYVVWEGGATVAVGTASSGTKYAKCQPSANNYYLRKSLTLEVGKTYLFEVMTKSPDGKNHRAVAKVGDRSIQGDLTNKTEWTKTSIEFTVAQGESEAIFWVYSFPVSEVNVDDFMVYEKGTTKISETKEKGLLILPGSTDGIFRISSPSEIKECRIFDISGKLVKQYLKINSAESAINLADSPNGLYILHLKNEQGETTAKKIFR